MQQSPRKTLINFIREMRSKIQTHLNLRVVLLFSFLLLLTVFIVRSSFPAPIPPSTATATATATSPSTTSPSEPTCNKIPPSLAQAIVHYAKSEKIPQQTLNEISVTAQILAKKSPCNFLIFGLGHDSLMWASLNHGGRTVFLEENISWIRIMRGMLPSLESYRVVYNTKVNQADELMESSRVQECKDVHEVRTSQCPLSLKELPDFVHEIEWDLIMVDAPTGYFTEAPGRMGAIYTAGMMARWRKEGETHVFVHDVNRPVEDKFSKAFLCEGYLTKQEGKLRHFTIPSYRGSSDMPFCP